MSGYYPDGVTGNEFAIAGADREWDDEREVTCSNSECDIEGEPQTVEMLLQSYGSTEWADWECPKCGHLNSYEGDTTDHNAEAEWADHQYDLLREERFLDE